MPDFGRPRVAAGGPSGHTRTEFVILFIWKEPTPSDSLRGEDDKAVAANPAAPAGFPAPGRFPGAGRLHDAARRQPLNNAAASGGVSPLILHAFADEMLTQGADAPLAQ